MISNNFIEKQVRDKLLEIELKHYDYFRNNKKSIVDFITIHWDDPVYLSVKDNRLPNLIWQDIAEVFEIV